MTDLLSTVRQRYTRQPGLFNLSVLSFRIRDRQSEERRERMARQSLERGVLQKVNRDMLQYAAQWKRQMGQAEKQWQESSRKYQKTVNLFVAESRRLAKEDTRRVIRKWREEEEYERRRKG